MTAKEDLEWAKAAWRETARRCVVSLAARLDRVGRAHMAVPAMRIEGKEQVELADAIRKQAKRAGLVK